MSRPRPIAPRRPSAPPRRVHFPPSPVLARAYLAHSPSSYDRTPIAVEQNACALPARGCPGRTYTLTNERAPRHPRSCAALAAVAGGMDYDSCTTPYDPPVAPVPPIPLLVSDLTSSDESDGLTSPPPEAAPAHTTPASPAKHGAASDGLQTSSPGALAFLPHPPSTPDRARRRNRDRRNSPAREAVAALLAAHRAVTEDAIEEDADAEPGFKRLDPTIPTSTLSVCRLEEADEGCLAGF